MVQNANSYVTGTFIAELKNRFLCQVEIDGNIVECYVPSSCRLSNFFDLNEKKVLVAPNKATNTRTAYALFAIPFKNNYIVLNTSSANIALNNSIHGKRFSFLGKRATIRRECIVSGYKCDLFAEDTNTIIEVKSVLTNSTNAVFPTVFSQRTINQLQKLDELLQSGYNVLYCIVSLNPYVSLIQIPKQSYISPPLHTAISHGLTLKGYSIHLHNHVPRIKKEVPIVF